MRRFVKGFTLGQCGKFAMETLAATRFRDAGTGDYPIPIRALSSLDEIYSLSNCPSRPL